MNLTSVERPCLALDQALIVVNHLTVSTENFLVACQSYSEVMRRSFQLNFGTVSVALLPPMVRIIAMNSALLAGQHLFEPASTTSLV